VELAFLPHVFHEKIHEEEKREDAESHGDHVGEKLAQKASPFTLR
jgi:hypothetical protein